MKHNESERVTFEDVMLFALGIGFPIAIALFLKSM